MRKAIRAIAVAGVFCVVAACGKGGQGPGEQGEGPAETDELTVTYTARAIITDPGGVNEYPGLQFTVTKKGGVHSLHGTIPAAGGAVALGLDLNGLVRLEGENAGVCGFFIAAQRVTVGSTARTFAGTRNVHDPEGGIWDGVLNVAAQPHQIAVSITEQTSDPQDGMRIYITSIE
ncbi:MAG: hypothetical protein LBU95_01355 [Rikenellaceae bacterium]|jgi:hypothetical protein|nr:hypothetical protein [Rikenellaceae bacterium]